MESANNSVGISASNGEDCVAMPPPPRIQKKENSTIPPPPPMVPSARLMPPPPPLRQLSTNKRPHPTTNLDTDESDDRKRRCLNDNKNEQIAPDGPNQTHIIFAIDFSGSMRKADVRTKNGAYISRWDAVFECIDGFLLDQVQHQSGQNEEEAIVIDDEDDCRPSNITCDGTAVVSVIIFNDEAKTLLRHMPLVGDGQKVRKALETARKLHIPKGGTGFSAGFGLAKSIGQKDGSGRRLTAREIKHQNTVVVFLSDGRPGDLQPRPPFRPSDPMQTTFRRKGTTYPAAGQHLEKMQQVHGDRFALHLICIYEEGSHWLKYLAERYGGNFHAPDLDMNDETFNDETVFPNNSGLFDSDDEDEVVELDMNDETINHETVVPNNRGLFESDDEDEVVELVVKSQDTLLREKFARARAAGQLYSVHDTTTAGGSSMRSTFRSISSSVTAMRGGSRLRERQGVVFKESSAMVTYKATRMILDKKKERISVPSNEKVNGRKVKVSLHPFAQGGLRNVYRMKQKGMPCQVAKESRHEVSYNERLRFHRETSMCQARALMYSKRFNRKKKKTEELRGTPSITMLRAEVIRLNDERAKGGFRYLSVESEIKGKYSKWNSNNGYVNPSTCRPCNVAQTFSHFSYEASGQKEMVVDIQGSEYTYTDPQLHSVTKEFGRADRGLSGFKDFFKTHRCNSICKSLQLKDRSIEFDSPGVKKELS